MEGVIDMENQNLTRLEYMTKLEEKLSTLPEIERKNALNYYDNHIKESANEAEAIEKLGSPAEVAASILSSYVARANQAPPVSAHPASAGSASKNTKWIWIIVLAVLFSPVLLGLAGGLIGVTVGLGGGAVGIVAGGASMILGGLASLILAIPIMFQDFGFGLVAGGTGLLLIGVGIIFVVLIVMLVKWVVGLITTAVNNRKGSA